jgi:hypothetical protein
MNIYNLQRENETNHQDPFQEKLQRIYLKKMDESLGPVIKVI